jgi:hypothetical protein
MKEKILQMVDAYWKFDEAQQPTSSWHDKQDLLKALEELLQPAVSGRSEQLKCYHYNYEWKSDGQGGNLKYCNDCKCYV